MDKLHSDLKGRVHFIDEATGYKEVTRSPKDTQLRNSKAHEALLFRNYTSSNISSALKLCMILTSGSLVRKCHGE